MPEPAHEHRQVLIGLPCLFGFQGADERGQKKKGPASARPFGDRLFSALRHEPQSGRTLGLASHGRKGVGELPYAWLTLRARGLRRHRGSFPIRVDECTTHGDESLADDWPSGQVAIWQKGGLTLTRSHTYTSRRVRSIVSMSPNGRVTLPASTRRALGLEGESFFEVHQQGSAIVLMPVALVPLTRARTRPTKKRAN
jgi:bifunctional DNA-binding transcriptional regulator/antitoxin component of YhaV-PrlF toxin-antitoxin module